MDIDFIFPFLIKIKESKDLINHINPLLFPLHFLLLFLLSLTANNFAILLYFPIMKSILERGEYFERTPQVTQIWQNTIQRTQVTPKCQKPKTIIDQICIALPYYVDQKCILTWMFYVISLQIHINIWSTAKYWTF